MSESSSSALSNESYSQNTLAASSSGNPVPIELIPTDEFDSWNAAAPDDVQHWIAANEFSGRAGQHLALPGPSGIARVIVGFDPNAPLWSCASAGKALPPGEYRVENVLSNGDLEQLALGWGLSQYEFLRYKPATTRRGPRVLIVENADLVERVCHQLAGIELTRNLINTPAGDMMPEHLAATMGELAAQFGAEWDETVGDDLLRDNFPAIHAVGRASSHAPRLLDLRWGANDAPKVTLVGKGVCFDSGGLDIKPASGMRLMKKDMGGAAHVLGLARTIMGSNLPVRLRVLIPAVENAISSNSYRPGDIVPTRAGLHIEIENTDAEGRVVLSDALAEGGAEQPEVMIDFATLTGAARVALGTELPAMFSNSDTLADALTAHGLRASDPMWRMPLHAPYMELIESKVGDIMNGAPAPFGGAILAALFLEAFVPDDVTWAHFDIMAWNNRARPGRPEGGEAVTTRAIFDYLRARYAS